MPLSVEPRRPRSLQIQRIGRRRLAVLAAGTLTVIGTGALASPEAPRSPRPAATRLTHDRVLSYPSEQVWPAAIRYLRVDRDYTLVDRDRDAGFILFDFSIDGRPDGPTGRGSLEMIATKDSSGRAAVKVQVSTDAGPTHLPHAIADGLANKLRAERGQPAPPPRPEAPPPPPEPDGPWADPPRVDEAR